MRKLYLIGIGAGNPEYITMQAIKALNAVDVFFFMDKGEAKQDLIEFRKQICERYIKDNDYRIVEAEDPVRDNSIVDYVSRVRLWHQERSIIYERTILKELGENQSGAFLVWGDPSLYDSTIRIVDQIIARGNLPLELEVIPGISSMQALAAKHKIGLNSIGESVVITTGRQLSSCRYDDVDNVVVMLDGKESFKKIRKEDFDISWGAYVGMEQEILLSGKLSEIADEIERVRHEERQKNGWIMDVYVLRRPRTH